MSKELLNVKWHKIQSCWCENLSSKILIFVKKSQVFVKLDSLNYKWSQPWTEISSVTFFISTSKKTSTASFLYKLFLIYHCTLIKYFVETKRLAVKKTVSFLLCNSFSPMFLIISKNRETIIENKRAIDIFWWPGQITKIEPKRYLFFLHVWQDGCILIDKSALKIVRESVNFFRHGLIWNSWTQNYIFSSFCATIIVCLLFVLWNWLKLSY